MGKANEQHFMNCKGCGASIDILTSWKGLCYRCGMKAKYEIKVKCAYHPNEDVTKRKCILKPCSSCLHNELIQVDNNEARV